MSRIVVFANGALADPLVARSLIQPGDEILCADGGTHHALALGLKPTLVIGDLDSISAEDRQQIEAAGVPLRRHSHDKNETDLELTLQAALERKPSAILIIGALGERLDHTLGNIAMLSAPALVHLDVRMDDGLEEVFFCRNQSSIHGLPGDLVSLVPWGTAAEGIRTQGLKWPLRDETLYPDRTRGISNEMLEETASVSVASGLLLIIRRRKTQPGNRTYPTERIP